MPEWYSTPPRGWRRKIITTRVSWEDTKFPRHKAWEVVPPWVGKCSWGGSVPTQSGWGNAPTLSGQVLPRWVGKCSHTEWASAPTLSGQVLPRWVHGERLPHWVGKGSHTEWGKAPHWVGKCSDEVLMWSHWVGKCSHTEWGKAPTPSGEMLRWGFNVESWRHSLSGREGRVKQSLHRQLALQTLDSTQDGGQTRTSTRH